VGLCSLCLWWRRLSVPAAVCLWDLRYYYYCYRLSKCTVSEDDDDEFSYYTNNLVLLYIGMTLKRF